MREGGGPGQGLGRVLRVPALRRSVVIELAGGASSAAIAAALAVAVLELWRADLRIPFAYTGDVNFYLMLAKDVLGHAWPYVNHDLGAPFGQQLYDFALGGEHLDLLLLKGVGLFTTSTPLALNVLYLASFPLSAWAAYAVLRWAGSSRLVACSCAVVYALAPYHFARGESHIFLSLDFAVPFGAYLVLGTAAGKGMFRRNPDRRGPLAWTTMRSLLTIGACIAVASTGEFYYGGFAFLLVAFALLARIVAGPTRASFASGAAILVTLACVFAINLAPTIAYAAAHGKNYAAAERQPSDSDVYGLKLAQLLEPVPGHRVEALANLTRFYNWTAERRTVTGLEQPALGSFASVGFLWLFVVLVATCVGFRRQLPAVVARSRHVAFAAWTAFLIGSVGAFGTLVAYLVTPQLRAWNRISIFIAFFGVLGCAILLEALRQRLSATLSQRLLFAAALIAVTAAAVFDQTTKRDVPQYRWVAASYRNDDSFVRTIERRLPHRAMVFELPYVPFPEGLTTGRTNGYDAIRPYLHSHSLRWSYGAMKGRPQDWQEYLVEKPLPQIVAGLAAAGFAGIDVDQDGYVATGLRPARTLRRILHETPLASGDHRFLFFDLRRDAARLRTHSSATEIARLRTATLMPPRAEAWRSVSPAEERSALGGRSLWVTGRRARLDLYEPGPAETVTFEATLSSRHGPGLRRTPSLVTLTWPGGVATRFDVGPGGTAVSRRVHLLHGHNIVAVETLGPPIYAPWDRRTLYLQILNARFAEHAFALVTPNRRLHGRHKHPHRLA